MSNVRNLVTDTMTSNGLRQYVGQAEPVIAALEQAANQAADSIRSAARSKGISEDEVNGVLQQAGLYTPPAPVVEESAPEGGLEATVARLASQVDQLVQAARRHGVRF